MVGPHRLRHHSVLGSCGTARSPATQQTSTAAQARTRVRHFGQPRGASSKRRWALAHAVKAPASKGRQVERRPSNCGRLAALQEAVWGMSPNEGRSTRSASTVAGMSGVTLSSWRTSGSNGVNAVGTAARPIPRSRATGRRGTPSATSRRTNAQSSTEITQPICRGGLVSTAAMASISSVARADSSRAVQWLCGAWRACRGWRGASQRTLRLGDPVPHSAPGPHAHPPGCVDLASRVEALVASPGRVLRARPSRSVRACQPAWFGLVRSAPGVSSGRKPLR